MARSSKYEHLKSDILEQFTLGKSVNDVLRAFPDVPKQTLRDWFNSTRPQKETPISPTLAVRKEIEVTAQTVSEQGTVDSVRDSVSLKVVPFRGDRQTLETPRKVRASYGDEEETEFAIAVRTLKDIADDPEAPHAVRVQSAVALLKVAQMKLETPAIAFSGEQEAVVDVQSEREKLKNMDGSKLRQKYLEALG